MEQIDFKELKKKVNKDRIKNYSKKFYILGICILAFGTIGGFL